MALEEDRRGMAWLKHCRGYGCLCVVRDGQTSAGERDIETEEEGDDGEPEKGA